MEIVVTSEQSDPPDSVEEYIFNYYKKAIPNELPIKKWRFYRDGKTWLVDDARGVHETVNTSVLGGTVTYRCRLRIERDTGEEVAYMSLE